MLGIKRKLSLSSLKDGNFSLLILAISPLLIFSITREHYFISDDYYFFFSVKLYNLIQGSLLSFENILEESRIRFIPFNLFINQFLPLNPAIFHGLIILFFFITSIIIYFILYELTENKKLALLAATIYSFNYSIHFKSLYWACFHYNITNALTGFLSILFLIFILKKNNYYFLNTFLYIALSLITVTNYETGLIYPIVSIFIILTFFKKKILYCILPILALMFYVTSVALITGDFLPMLKSRLTSNYSENYAKNIELKDSNYFYYYRSTYAPRNKIGYSLRIVDNLALTANLNSLEESIKYYFDKEKIKEKYVKNFELIFYLTIILLFIFLFYIFKNIKDFKYRKHLIYFLALYFCLFIIYTFIFFRRDINVAMAFPSSIILAILIFEFYRLKKKIFCMLISIIYLLPSLIYASTGFEYVGDFSRTKNNQAGQEYVANAKKNNKDFTYEGYKYYYYYVNYEDNKKFLKKFKNANLQKFSKDLKLN